MWSSLLEQDLSWHVFSKETSFGRPRQGPSWSWTHSSDDSEEIAFSRLYEDNYYQLHEIIEPDTEGDVASVSTAILLTGTILAVSLQIYEVRGGMEVKFPSMRNCRVFEQEGDMLSTQIELCPLPGSVESSLDQGDTNTSASFLQGEFMADYRFWPSEAELQHELQHIMFFPLGVDDFDDFPYSHQTDEAACWVAGMVLRPSSVWGKGQSPEHENQFERVGWLRYCTNKTRSQYNQAGTKTKFLVV